MEMPQVDLEKCTGCGTCAAACYCGAVVIVDGKAHIIEMMMCGWCTVCEAICPSGALSCPYEIILEEIVIK